MPDGQVLEFTNVTKRFNEVTAVADLSARVEPGAVTAFLGPNGAGKTTTLRILLGQVRATSGTATIGGTSFAELRQPLRTIGSVLEETVYRPRRTASRQLTIAAKANGIALSRVGEVLAEVGLEGEGDSRIGGFSLGMRQRLSVAHALLGDPGALVFDEPANGLDPEGIRWMRLLMRRLADEGRTVLVSSHVLSEVEQVADNVLVLSKGQLVLSSGIETLADPAAGSVVVDAADRAALTTALSSAGFDVEVLRSGLTVRGGDASTVGAVAAAAGIALSTLVQRGPTLEDVFIDLIRGGKLEARASAAASQLALPATSAFAASAVAASAADDTRTDPTDEDIAAEAEAVTADASATDDADDADDRDDAGLMAEIASVSAAVSDSVPSDPVAAAAIAATALDARDEPDTETEYTDEDALAAAAVEEAEHGSTGIHSAEEDAVAEAAVDDAAASVADEAAAVDVAADEDADSTDAGSTELPEEDRADSSPSFDQILFGTATPPVASGAASVEAHDAPVHDVEQIFADRDDAAEGGNVVASEAGEQDAGEPSGIEIFGDLNGERSDSDADADSGSGSGSDADADADADAGSDTDLDPRSAAVSTMLAAAARAYYEDEPKDYPLADRGDAESSEWTVASTGVIDAVPTPEPATDTAPEENSSASDENHAHDENHEHDEDHEHGHDGAHSHDGEHRQD